MDELKYAKLDVCNELATILESLDAESAVKLRNWLKKVVRYEGIEHYEYWLEEAKHIEAETEVH